MSKDLFGQCCVGRSWWAGDWSGEVLGATAGTLDVYARLECCDLTARKVSLSGLMAGFPVPGRGERPRDAAVGVLFQGPGTGRGCEVSSLRVFQQVAA